MAPARTMTGNWFDTELESVNDTITRLELSKATLLQRAFDDGGVDRVVEVVNEIEILKDTRFELIRANLDRNNGAFKQLSDAAKTEAKALQSEVKKLNNIAKILNGIASVVGLLTRILVRFAI